MNYWKWFQRVGIALVIVVCLVLYAATPSDKAASNSGTSSDDSAYRNIK